MAQSNKPGKRILAVVSHKIIGRVFFHSRILNHLSELGVERLDILNLYSGDGFNSSAPGLDLREVKRSDKPGESLADKIDRRVKRFIDRNFGFMPVAVRMNRNLFNPKTVRPGHPNGFYNLDLMGFPPDVEWVNRFLKWSYFNLVLRRNDDWLVDHCREANIDAVLLLNSQTQATHLAAASARRAGLPVIGYITSWDHPVGKGPVITGLDRYLVQNRQMESDLVEYHGVDREAISVTGWPQMDRYSGPFDKAGFRNWLADKRLDSARPTILLAGNSPKNSPNEDRIMADLLDRRQAQGQDQRWNVVVRPHPNDRDRFFPLEARFKAVHVQRPSFDDLDILTMLLKGCAGVVCTAGSILLDAVANDRPVVGLKFDPYDNGDRALVNNFERFHYLRLDKYGACVIAYDYDQVLSGIAECLDFPDRLAPARARLRQDNLDPLDGRASQRTAEAIVAAMAGSSRA